jgi:hypothetical protein
MLFSGKNNAPTGFSTFLPMTYLVLRKITAFITELQCIVG